jgi:hypothetical protein
MRKAAQIDQRTTECFIDQRLAERFMVILTVILLLRDMRDTSEREKHGERGERRP